MTRDTGGDSGKEGIPRKITMSICARDSYREGKTGHIPPQKYFPPKKNPFSIDIIWHNYNKIRLHVFYNFYIWQGYAYALKSAPKLISEH